MEAMKLGISYGFSSALIFLLLIAISPPSFTFSTNEEESKVQLMIAANIEDVLGRSFDYIIVGGGTSGCPLAATLSQAHSVLLLERGGSPYGDPLIEERWNFGDAYLKTDEFTSISQHFVSEDGVSNQRGRVLGGSTAINGGFYSRASGEDVKEAGWDPELVREAFEWVESKIVFPAPLTAWQFALVGGMVQAGIRPLNDFSLEHLKGTKVGGGIFDAHRRRHTSADLLAAGNPHKLTILLNATVQNVIFHDAGGGNQPRAHGIRFIQSHGDPNKFYEVYVNDPEVSGSWGEVILCAGSLGSPQILMLSGIGPREHLIAFNITPMIDAKQVGQFMQDNPTITCPLNYSSHVAPQLHSDPPQVAGIENNFQFFIETAASHPGLNTSLQVPILGKLAHPISRGSLRLLSRDPRENPSVEFNYLSEEKDLDTCVEMVHMIDKVARSRSVSGFLQKKQAILPKISGTSIAQELRDFCKKNVVTIYHYHGGCVVGSVVDRDYRVLGVGGLRVVDFSTFLDSPGTNPMATVLMLGRYQGVKMLREKKQRARKSFSTI